MYDTLLIASEFGWSPDVIDSLPNRERRFFAEAIQRSHKEIRDAQSKTSQGEQQQDLQSLLNKLKKPNA